MTVEELLTNPWFWAISAVIDFWWMSRVFDWMLGTNRDRVPE